MRLGNYANYIMHRNIIKITSNCPKNDYCFESNGTLRDIVDVCDDVNDIDNPGVIKQTFYLWRVQRFSSVQAIAPTMLLPVVCRFCN